MAKSSLDHFVDEIKKAWGPLTTETVEKCSLLLKELVQAAGTVESTADKELYRDPDSGFVLLAYTEQEGCYRVPHDHGNGWVIYAVQNGEMEMGTYRQVVSQDGKLRLVRRESYRMGPGDCRVFLPGDIHDTRCVSKSVQILRLTSCDLKIEIREGRMMRYPDYAG